MRSAITPSRSACSMSKGFWTGLADFMDHVSASGFLSQGRRKQLLMADTPAAAIDRLDEAAANATQGMVW